MNKRIVVSLLALCLVSWTYASNVIILNPGCRQFNSAGDCVQCSNRFYKNNEGICQPVNSNCKTYKIQNGACTSCYDGFSIIQDTCLPKYQVDDLLGLANALANCNQIGENGLCKKCSSGYYFDAQGFCNQIPDTCANFNTKIGKCLGCYSGYSLNEKNQCVVQLNTISDPGCSKFQSGQCVQCSVGYYFNARKQCTAIPSTCQRFDTVNFVCKECYQGYSLDSRFNCVQNANDAPIDLGCSKFENGKCIQCSQGYYFNKNRACTIIPPSCSDFDTSNQVCRGCYSGYALDSKRVCVLSVVQSTDLGCSLFQNGKCIRCSFGYYFNKNRICKAIPSLCGRFDTTNQICTACYPGYTLDSNNNCIVNTVSNSDPGCNSFQNGKCVKCSYGYYFDRNRNCKQIPVTCSDYDTSREVCVKCYPGYDVDRATNSCVESTVQASDPGCSKFFNGACIQCSNGYYFDSSRKCQIVPPSCSNFDTNLGICKGCYVGYALDGNNFCVLSKDSGFSDAGCNQFKNGKCVACSVGYYFNSAGICQQIPSTCNNFDSINGICRGCYEGYSLNSKNQCIVSVVGPSDPNCAQFRSNRCFRCSVGSFFDSRGRCIISDPLCKRFNPASQKCLQCYPGFSLDTVKSACFETPASSIDPNCKTFINNICTQCSFRYFKGSDGLCKAVDPTCKLYNVRTGQCNSCYDGYKLAFSKCIEDTSGVSDPNCAEWKNGACTKCSYGSIFGSDGKCRVVDPLCMTWNDANGQCKSCYPSFQLVRGKCILSTKSYDPNCNKFSTNGECIQCSRGFYFNSNRICTQVDPLCASFDSKSARCLGCYTGYKIKQGSCIQDTQKINDEGCAQFKNSQCTKCSVGYYFEQNGRCKAINPQCSYFDVTSKQCGLCYPGYVLNNGNCVVSNKDNLCAEWKDGICMRCVNRAYFNDQGGCNEVNSYCNDYDKFDGACLSCYGGFTLKDGECVRSEQSDGCISFSKDSTCLQCQNRKYLDNGRCLKIDDYCQQFNFFKKTCTQCYKGYAVVDGKCIVSEVKAESQIQNCFTYSLKGNCIECFDRFYLQKNTCRPVNILCKKYDVNNGNCIDCYTGFKLQQGKCSRK